MWDRNQRHALFLGPWFAIIRRPDACAIPSPVLPLISWFRSVPGLVALLCLSACGDEPWNSPYPAGDSDRAILYGSFSERPKHLDPASSYSENEAQFNGQIYEPVVQYHFLRRPYELVPLTASSLPQAQYFNAEGQVLPADAASEDVAEVVYRITIREGIRYQPHPAFARDDAGLRLLERRQDTATILRVGKADWKLQDQERAIGHVL